MYEPQVDDYVIWTTESGHVHKGWVYFVGKEIEQKRGWPTPQPYITIEIGTTLRRQRAKTSNIFCPIISQLSKLTEPTNEDVLQPDPP